MFDVEGSSLLTNSFYHSPASEYIDDWIKSLHYQVKVCTFFGKETKMRRYESSSIPEYLTVRSIVAVLNTHFSEITEEATANNGERHDFPELLYVREGNHAMFVGDRIYPLEAGQIIIYAPLEPHTGASGGEADVAILSFKADFGRLPSIYNRVITLSEQNRALLEDIIKSGAECYKMRQNRDEIGGMLIRPDASEYVVQKLKRDIELFLIEIYRSEGLLYELSETGRETSEREQFFKIVEMLRTMINEELSLDEIARRSSMSVSKLKMLFRKYAAKGPIDFFIDMKLDLAKEMISQGKHNLTEISELLGFSSLHYFSRLFKSRSGVSPSRWEKAERGV